MKSEGIFDENDELEVKVYPKTKNLLFKIEKLLWVLQAVKIAIRLFLTNDFVVKIANMMFINKSIK